MMGFFAAGNDLVTLILALIPVAVFVLSNLYKAFAKAAPVPPQGGKGAPQGGKPKTDPRIMDLEAFLREAKKQGGENRTSRPKTGTQNDNWGQAERPNKGPVSPVFAERVTFPQNPPPLPPQKQRSQNSAPTSPPKGQKGQFQGIPGIPQKQGTQPAQIPSLNPVGLNLSPTRPMRTMGENPVGMALALLRKPQGGAGAFVLQEILGTPRCRRPHRPA